jgi:putative transcriptional regulator
MNKKLTEALQETVRDFHEIGLMDDQTMREFDALCLPKVKSYTPAQIKKLRQKNKASQAVFAAYLNTSVSTVQKWEQGQKKPNGISLKLLSLVDRYGLVLLAA